jgi:uncharacterized SAM-binding protein YcdF (DUF218 family)
MDAEGHLNEDSTARISEAIRAFEAKEAPYLVTSGWNYRGEYTIPIAEAMRDYAAAHGVPAQAILCDTHSRDTVGDAVFTKRNIVLPKGWKRLLVITSDYHVKRTKAIFEFIYGADYDITVRGAASKAPSRPPEEEQQSLLGFYATFEGVKASDDEAIWELLRQKHPFYNGKTHPKI